MKTKDLMRRFIPAILILVTIQGCQKIRDAKSDANALLKIDKEFSRYSREVGPNKAFLNYIDDSAVLLRPNCYPIVGRDKIVERYTEPDTGFMLTWVPSFAYVSDNGDLGYTYGIYTMQSISAEGEAETNNGTYVTIWKKNKEGNWKFVLDTGNPGLERKKADLDQD